MRVKTVPRHRVPQSGNNTEPVSEIVVGKLEKPRHSSSTTKGKDMSENGRNLSNESCTGVLATKQSANICSDTKEKKESLNYSGEALDMSIKHKNNEAQSDSMNHCSIAGPSNSEYCDASFKKDKKEAYIDNNNNTVNCCSVAGPSNRARSEPCEKEGNINGSDEDEPVEAVNLCKKDWHEEDAPNSSGGADDRLKDTFLYKIMTDPTFLENIQKNKQSRRYACIFCKQEFVNGDELAEHMDVKKDESNQVICCACKKTFAQKRYLRYHQRCHFERTKFTCDICSKKYTRLDNLTRHNAFHINPDKFSCTYCEKTFARKDLLNKHLKCHDNKYRFYCETCQKYFKGPVTLDNHKKIFHSVA